MRAESSNGTSRPRGLTDRLLDFPRTLDFLWERLPAGLYVFNYHRIGDANVTDFDPNVFSCDERTFREHVRLLKSNFEIIGADALVDAVLPNRARSERQALITFDDGYRDNFTSAFPILREEGATAIFFLPTALVGSPAVPWWDEIAWLLRNTKEERIEASWLRQPLSRDQVPFANLVASVLTEFKANPSAAEEKVAELRQRLRCQLDGQQPPLFMSWDEAKEMRRGGMSIGSHAHSHQILAHLTPDEQSRELTTSKSILESHLGEPVHTVAYPVGTKGAFNAATLEAARSSGYKAGFSYIPGVNRVTHLLPFELRRISVDNNPDTMSVKLSTLLATELGIRAKELLDQQRRVLGRFRNRIR